jgi:hypothetical protein
VPDLDAKLPTMAATQAPPSRTPPADQVISNPKSTNGTTNQQEHPPRRSSFGFLRSGSGKMSKKQRALAEEEMLRQQREANAVPQQAPLLPSQPPMPTIPTFGGENSRPDSYAIVADKAGAWSNQVNPQAMQSLQQKPPIPPVPEAGAYVDPYARTESMTNRGRYSYASSAVSTLNSPRRVRRRRDPTPFK